MLHWPVIGQVANSSQLKQGADDGVTRTTSTLVRKILSFQATVIKSFGLSISQRTAADMSSQVTKAARRVTHELHGVVVSAGLMQKTVKVRVGGQRWNKIVKKFYADPKHYLVHDPNSSLRTGDVVAIAPGWPTSRHKRHVVKHIIAPYGQPIEDRPAIPSLDEIILEREAKKEAKDERKAVKKRSEEERRVALKKSAADGRDAKRASWEQLMAKSGQ